MIFSILVGIGFVGLGWLLYKLWTDWGSYALIETVVGKAFATLGLLLVVPFVSFMGSAVVSTGLGHLFTPDFEKVGDPDKVSLVAATAREETEGQFRGNIFASYGYIDGNRVISYITKNDDGGMKLGYIDVDEAFVYEKDDVKPELHTQHWQKRNDWIIPGPFETAETYAVYVPTGTIVEGFSIAP